MQEHATRRLPAVLRPFVQAVRGYHLTSFRPGVHVGLPTATLTCVFDLGGGLDLSGLDLAGVRRFTACFSGLSPAPALIHHDGTQHGIMLHLTPLGLSDLFGVPAAELTGGVVSATELMGTEGRVLEERLRAAPAWSSLDVLVRDLVGRVPERPRENLAAEVWERITRRRGRVTVRELAAESGWSERHLRGSVRSEIGLGAKTIGRLARFEATVPALSSGRPIAAVAADCGYADQAHLTREWRRLAGVTPGQWLAREEFAPAQ